MEVKQGYPPNFEEIKEVFKQFPEEVIFCWGNTIYNPSGKEIPKHLIIHESVHSKQQGDNPKEWWDRYLVDKEFRLEQEIEAYGTQYAHIKKEYPNRAVKYFLHQVTKELSSELYGNIISYHKAESKIRNYAKSVV